jgi:hypothetical protein
VLLQYFKVSKHRSHPTEEASSFIGKQNKPTTRKSLKSLINLPARSKIYCGPSQFHGFEEDFQHL